MNKKNDPLKNSLISSMHLHWRHKEKDLNKAVWVNEVALSLQVSCFTIELLPFWANKIRLCCSRRYSSCLTHFGSTFPFVPPENIKNKRFSDVFKGYKKSTLFSTGLILVVYRNYNILHTIFLFWKLFGILNSVF